MTLDVYHGRKTTTQQQPHGIYSYRKEFAPREYPLTLLLFIRGIRQWLIYYTVGSK